MAPSEGAGSVSGAVSRRADPIDEPMDRDLDDKGTHVRGKPDVPLAATSGQLALDVALPHAHTFENFVSGDSLIVASTVRALADGSTRGLVYVHGAAAAGKTHLLHAALHAAAGRGDRVISVSLADAMEGPEVLPTAVLAGLDADMFVCLDDVDRVMGSHDWEEALFHLFNRIVANDGRLLMSARQAPAGVGCTLPDLASRLASGTTLSLRTLDETQCRLALRLRADERGLELSEEVMTFVLNRARRDMRSLAEFVDRLDKTALVEQRRVTVPFVSKWFDRLQGRSRNR